MTPIQRAYPLFSACGLNCGLCPRFHTEGASRCPGCGGEGFYCSRPACGVVSCNRRHGVEYCFQCGEYPCKKLDGAELVDSFITHRHMRKDSERAKRIGLEGYRAELNEKVEILRLLLSGYNDGRRKSFFCLAVNLLEIDDVRAVMAALAEETGPDMPVKEKAALAVTRFKAMGERRGVALKLTKKTS